MLKKSQHYDIGVVGDDNTGKSCLIYYYVKGEYVPDIDSGLEETYTKVLHGKPITILDSKSFNDLYLSTEKERLANTDTILLVYAINNRASFEAVEDVYNRMDTLLPSMPSLVLAGLKSDLIYEREVTPLEGRELAQTLGAVHFEASARTGHGVEELFLLLQQALERKHASNETEEVKEHTDDKTLTEPEIDQKEHHQPNSPPPASPTSPTQPTPSRRVSHTKDEKAKNSCCVIM